MPPLSLIDDLAASVIHGAEYPRRVYSGWIFSQPGSADQPWHQDSCPLFETGINASLPIYALNVFCGIHDGDDSEQQQQQLLLEMRPTEFVVGSHVMEPEEAMGGIIDGDGDDNDAAVVSALLGKGDVLMYDYRICHRGTSNLTSSSSAAGGGGGGNKGEGGGRDDDDNGDDGAAAAAAGIVRKVLYLMYARPWFREHLNFGQESLFRKDA